jgi:hypothetical protein
MSSTTTTRGSAHNGGPDGSCKVLDEQLREIREGQTTFWTLVEGRLSSLG